MNFSQINKKLITIVVVILALFVVVFIGISVVNKDRNLEFSAIERKLKSGAEKYFKVNPELLPTGNGEQTVVGVTTLEDGKYIPMMSKMIKGDTICNGEVRVSNNGGHYVYFPYLNCGNEYVTTELYKKIIEPSNIVTEDDGLYEINGEYVFRGGKVNNFLEFAGQKWLIIKIDKDKHIKIIQYDIKEKQIWDNRYNIDRGAKDGINDYTKSTIEDFLLETFNDEEFILEKSKGLVVYKPLCIGKRKENETNKNGSVECSVLSDPAPIGLIQVSDYMNASLDVNCTETTSRSCQNYNYLTDTKNSWWTLTPVAENTHRVYKFSYGYLASSSLTNDSRVRAVLYLSENVIYAGGTGTLEEPYIVK